jgi:hypothetical protein
MPRLECPQVEETEQLPSMRNSSFSDVARRLSNRVCVRQYRSHHAGLKTTESLVSSLTPQFMDIGLQPMSRLFDIGGVCVRTMFSYCNNTLYILSVLPGCNFITMI